MTFLGIKSDFFVCERKQIEFKTLEMNTIKHTIPFSIDLKKRKRT